MDNKEQLEEIISLLNTIEIHLSNEQPNINERLKKIEKSLKQIEQK